MKTKKYLIVIPLLFSIVLSVNCGTECDPYLPGSVPGIELSNVPPLGSSNNLGGRINGVDPDDYRIAVYIFVPVTGGWWNKPTFASPLTIPDCTSFFSCDITTGGEDETATKIRAYLVPKDYNPPLVSGGSIPQSIELNSAAWKEVSR